MEQIKVRDWKFFLGDDDYAFQKDFDDSAWQDVKVPHDWSITQDFTKAASSGTGYLPGGIGWYRCHFSTDHFEAINDGILKVNFEGIYKNADVWVNGYHMGYWASGYSSFQFDLTEIQSYNKDNEIVIAVRVDHTDIADSRWYNGSGITRPVTLTLLDKVYIDRYDTTFTTDEVVGGKAVVSTKTCLTNALNEEKTVKVRQTLKELDGTEEHLVGEESITIAADSKQNLQLTTEINDPKLWSSEEPNLYVLKTEVDVDGHVSAYEERVGIRTFVFDPDKGFLLNDQPAIKLKGVCLHEDAGCFGTAVPAAIWLRRLLKLKETGCNAVRMAHNPHSQVLYDLCDVLGFFVFDEAFDEWENTKNKWWQGHNVYPPKFEGYAKDFPVWHKYDLEDMVARNKNHASIIAWSIGNEIDYPNDPYVNDLFNEMEGNNDANKPAEERVYNPTRPDTRRLTSIAKELTKIVHQADSTRPVTLAAAFPELTCHTGLLETVDLIGYNYKEHLYPEHHKMFPDKPFVGSENRHAYEHWLAVKDNEYISGQFLWTGIDYLGESRGVWPKHGTYRGVIDMCGYPTQMFYRRKSWWSEELTAHLHTRPYDGPSDDIWKLIFRRWNYRPGDQVEIRLYANTEDFDVKIGDKPVEMSFDQTEGCYTAVVAYEEAPLTVEAHKDGETITDKLEPVTEPSQLVATVWEAPEKWAAYNTGDEEGAKIYQIELKFKDSQNRQTEAEKIVSYEGDETVEFLGFENGNVEDITNYKERYRRSHKGQMICYVQTKAAAANVTFLVDGFAPVEVQLP